MNIKLVSEAREGPFGKNTIELASGQSVVTRQEKQDWIKKRVECCHHGMEEDGSQKGQWHEQRQAKDQKNPNQYRIQRLCIK